MRKWLILIAILFGLINLNAQSGVFGNVYPSKGGGVTFKLNNIKRIMEGVTYTDFLELTITYCDSNYSTSGWELWLNALDPYFVAAMNSTPTIPLDAIKISSRMDDGTDIASDVDLSEIAFKVGEGSRPVFPSKCIQDKVILSFTCTSLMGYSFDFYDTFLSFDLKSKP